MKTVLVTGGAGFIGSHLCKRLLADGNSVVCIDNFTTGSRQNIVELLHNPFFEVIQHDITEPLVLEVDEIYNLACPASPISYQKDPVQTIRTNVLGSINMLDLARYNGARILQASTSEIYGDPEVHPQPESYVGHVNPIGLRSCYDEGKRCAETLFFDYHRESNVDIRIVRIFNTYGPNMQPNDGRVVSNFIVQALHDQDITIYGGGMQTRSFQFIDDLINGLVLAMKGDYIGPINLGNPIEFTIGSLAKIVLKQIPGSLSKIVFRDLPMDDPKQRQPDISLAKEKLNWEPHIQLNEGLSRTIKYFETTTINK